jgi:hypothetical protein
MSAADELTAGLRAELDRVNARLAEQPATDPAPIIQQLVTALEGSGTRMRSDQWYVEIEAVAAGKHYLNSVAAGKENT